MTTFYPSPNGAFNELVCDDAKIGSAYSGIGVSVPQNGLIVEGNVGIGTSSPGSARLAVIGGNVGIGVENPLAPLDVGGGIKIGSHLSACDSLVEAGMIRYNGVNLEYCNGSEWKSAVAATQQHVYYGFCQEKSILTEPDCQSDSSLLSPAICALGNGSKSRCACESGYTLTRIGTLYDAVDSEMGTYACLKN